MLDIESIGFLPVTKLASVICKIILSISSGDAVSGIKPVMPEFIPCILFDYRPCIITDIPRTILFSVLSAVWNIDSASHRRRCLSFAESAVLLFHMNQRTFSMLIASAHKTPTCDLGLFPIS